MKKYLLSSILFVLILAIALGTTYLLKYQSIDTNGFEYKDIWPNGPGGIQKMIVVEYRIPNGCGCGGGALPKFQLRFEYTRKSEDLGDWICSKDFGIRVTLGRGKWVSFGKAFSFARSGNCYGEILEWKQELFGLDD